MKLAVSELAALAPGTVTKDFLIVECLGIDLHTGLYRAECTDTEHPVLLMEYLPAGLVERDSGQVLALSGEGARYERAVRSYTTSLREANLIGHPAIALLDDCWRENGALYGVGPWQAGRTLPAQLALQKGPLGTDTLRQWARTICDALATLHQHDLLHGNLVFHMFRVRKTGELILPLIAGELFGEDIPPCIAPEQHPLNTKPGPVGPWSDVYQLSAVMYQLIAGAAPPSVLRRWEGAPLEPIGDEPQRDITGLIRATLKGLAMHHDARPQSVAAWLEIAGLPDRRSVGRHHNDVDAPDSMPAGAATHPRSTLPARALVSALPDQFRPSRPGFRASVWSRRDSASDDLDDIDGAVMESEETPLWVWLCLGVAVAAFLSILLRTI